MDAREAEKTLETAAERRRQAVDEGTAGWSATTTWSICAGALALGILIDADLIWLWGVFVVMSAGVAWTRGVRLKNHPASPRWTAALVSSFVLALVAVVIGQAVGRSFGVPVPATIGSLFACVVIVLVARPVQARWAASRRP